MNNAMLQQLFTLDADSNVSLQSQLRQKIGEAIIKGHFSLNLPLPSSRSLAKQLGISRITAVRAYEHLEDDG